MLAMALDAEDTRSIKLVSTGSGGHPLGASCHVDGASSAFPAEYMGTSRWSYMWPKGVCASSAGVRNAEPGEAEAALGGASPCRCLWSSSRLLLLNLALATSATGPARGGRLTEE